MTLIPTTRKEPSNPSQNVDGFSPILKFGRYKKERFVLCDWSSNRTTKLVDAGDIGTSKGIVHGEVCVADHVEAGAMDIVGGRCQAEWYFISFEIPAPSRAVLYSKAGDG